MCKNPNKKLKIPVVILCLNYRIKFLHNNSKIILSQILLLFKLFAQIYYYPIISKLKVINICY